VVVDQRLPNGVVVDYSFPQDPPPGRVIAPSCLGLNEPGWRVFRIRNDTIQFVLIHCINTKAVGETNQSAYRCGV
jgi:hypothetical protein